MPVDLPVFTLVHVALSLVGIVAGLVAVGGLMAGARFGGWIALFLVTSALTDLTGFGFPFQKVLPSHIVGAVSLVALLAAALALYGKRLAGGWRALFVFASVAALFLNVFVLLAQLLQKTPVLAALAPNPQAPAFAITQLSALLLFVLIGWGALRGFRRG